MDFENNIYNYRQLKYQTLHPDYLSNKLVTEVESNVVLPSTDKFDDSFCLLVVWISIFGLASWILYQAVREMATIKIRGVSIFPFFQTPCRNCKFYNRNLYLQCAVHPSIVLTKKARNCIDYCNNRQDLMHEHTNQNSLIKKNINN